MNDVEPRLTPPETKGHVSVARLNGYWYVACQSDQLSRRPIARTIVGIPMVLFRDREGRAGALLDRCPHRNVPLSLGRIRDDGVLECSYHGWCFDVGGACTEVPGLLHKQQIETRRVEAFPTIEQDGFVWVYATADVEPDSDPYEFPHAGDPDYTTVVRELEIEASVHAAAENALDVPHTAFLHRGLFRGTGTRNDVDVRVTRWHDRVEAEYIGEPRPEGIAGRILSPSGGIVEHWDRFLLPSISQVEYRLGPENHVLITSAWTPVTDFVSRMTAVISFRVRLPGWAIRPVLEPIAMKVFQQDADILEKQTETIRRFGGEQYMSTEIDVLGPHIWRLLRQAERGEEAPTEEPFVKEFTMRV